MKQVTKSDLKQNAYAFGTVYSYNNSYDFIVYKHNELSYDFFLFDPKNEGMSLTNGLEQVVYELIDTLLVHRVIPTKSIESILQTARFICQDSQGDYSQPHLNFSASNQLQALLKSPKTINASKVNQISCYAVYQDHEIHQEKLAKLPTFRSVKTISVTSWEHFVFTPQLLSLIRLLG